MDWSKYFKNKFVTFSGILVILLSIVLTIISFFIERNTVSIVLFGIFIISIMIDLVTWYGIAGNGFMGKTKEKKEKNTIMLFPLIASAISLACALIISFV